MTDHKALIAEARQLVYEDWIERNRRVLTRPQIVEELADALEAASVERAVVEAQALEQAADEYRSGQLTGMFMGRDDYPRAWLRARAVEIREGRQ